MLKVNNKDIRMELSKGTINHEKQNCRKEKTKEVFMQLAA